MSSDSTECINHLLGWSIKFVVAQVNEQVTDCKDYPEVDWYNAMKIC